MVNHRSVSFFHADGRAATANVAGLSLIHISQTISQKHKDTLVEYTKRLARALHVVGLVNIQFVLYEDQVYVIEVNPRSSRTVPYISKVTNVPMVDLATRCVLGEKLKDMGCGTGLHPEDVYKRQGSG